MSLIGLVKDKITQYIDVYLKLLKISFIEGAANILGYLIYLFTCLFILFCITLFLGFGMVEIFIAIGFTKLSAFFITIGLYLLSLIIIILLRKKMTRFFVNRVVKVMTENGRKEDEDD